MKNRLEGGKFGCRRLILQCSRLHMFVVQTRLVNWKWKEVDGFRWYLRGSFNRPWYLIMGGKGRRKIKDNFQIYN